MSSYSCICSALQINNLLEVNFVVKYTETTQMIAIKELKVKISSGHAIALWKKRCGIDQKKLII